MLHHVTWSDNKGHVCLFYPSETAGVSEFVPVIAAADVQPVSLLVPVAQSCLYRWYMSWKIFKWNNDKWALEQYILWTIASTETSTKINMIFQHLEHHATARQFTSLSLSPMFNPRPDMAFSQYFNFPSTIPPMLYTYISITYHQCYIILGKTASLNISPTIPCLPSLLSSSEITDNVQTVVILKCRT